MTNKYFFFRKSHNSNSNTYRVLLSTAVQVYDKLYDERLVFMNTLKHPTGDINQVYDDMKIRFFNRLKAKATQTSKNYWYSNGTGVIYTIEDQNPRDFKRFVDVYENCVLPNYEEKDYPNLDDLKMKEYPKPKSYYSVYELLGDEIAEKRNSNYEVTRENRCQEVAFVALDFLLTKYPTEHLEILVSKMKEYAAENKTFPFTFSNNAARVKINGQDNTELSAITRLLLEAASDKHQRYNRVEAKLLEKIDILDHTLLDHIAKYLKKRIAKHNGDHRDIVVKVQQSKYY